MEAVKKGCDPMDLYLMRHGKTIFNEKNITQGWCDSLLLEDSIQQAKQIHIDGLTSVYTSPTLRAKQTAYHVSDGMPFKEDFRLMEICYGHLEGESAKTLQLFYPNRYDFDHFEGFAGGESWKEAGSRFMEGILEIVSKEKPEAKILIVSHGAIITWFLHQLDTSITSKVDNLSYAHLTYDGQRFQIIQK